MNSFFNCKPNFPKLWFNQELKSKFNLTLILKHILMLTLKLRQKLKPRIYLKMLIAIIITAGIITFTCSCALLQKTIDRRTGFSALLKQTENHIRNEEWDKSRISLENSEKTWKKIKPWLQIDIDHDYVNSIESDFVKLYGYIEAKDKAESLATILMVQDMWDNIGTL